MVQWISGRNSRITIRSYFRSDSDSIEIPDVPYENNIPSNATLPDGDRDRGKLSKLGDRQLKTCFSSIQDTCLTGC